MSAPFLTVDPSVNPNASIRKVVVVVAFVI